MKSILSSIAIITVIIMGATVMTARGQSGFETEPVLKAKDLVAPELLKGPHFTVDDRVPVKGFLAYFTIRSDYGTFEAHGIHMFQIRVKEVYALAQLDDMSKTKEFTEAAGRAIARPVTSTVHMLVDPVETIEGFPGGVTRLWDRIKLGSEKVAEAATAPGASGGQKVADVSERVGGITVTALGYEKERRDLAKGLGVDPYTTNPVLSKKLSDMAWVAFSGRFGIQAAMSVLVPYSMAMTAVTITNTTVYDTPQGDLINKDQAIFAETGASEAQVQALMKNKQYSLSVLTALAQGLQRLQGVNGLASSVVDFAAAAKTQDETRFVAGSVNILARYHESVAPIAVTTAPGPIIGRTTNGTLVIPAAVDYVAWTERTSRMAQRDDFKAPDRTTWLSGQMSIRARKEFTARGWRVDESFSIAAER
ncbi:MAG: hypothetical protein DMD89_28455 [Candidatus Rokuibacteriota bacterium]|nr:MAG: hypothetical protein DMD89_28455 [Candidatus Rokubacteria bacterium]